MPAKKYFTDEERRLAKNATVHNWRVRHGLIKGVTHFNLPPGEAAFNCLYNDYVCRCKRGKLPFSLLKDEFRKLVVSNCTYCGVSSAQVRHPNRGGNGDFVYNGIDRVDNSKGYSADNCVPCCKICNRAKRDMPQSEFFAWAERLAAKTLRRRVEKVIPDGFDR
jgi:hypothetical protein